VLELSADAGGQGTSVAAPRPFVGEAREDFILARAGSWKRVVGKAIAQLFEAEGAALGDGAGGANPLGPVGEAPGHLPAPLQEALAVGQEQSSRAVEGGLVV